MQYVKREERSVASELPGFVTVTLTKEQVALVHALHRAIGTGYKSMDLSDAGACRRGLLRYLNNPKSYNDPLSQSRQQFYVNLAVLLIASMDDADFLIAVEEFEYAPRDKYTGDEPPTEEVTVEYRSSKHP